MPQPKCPREKYGPSMISKVSVKLSAMPNVDAQSLNFPGM